MKKLLSIIMLICIMMVVVSCYNEESEIKEQETEESSIISMAEEDNFEGNSAQESGIDSATALLLSASYPGQVPEGNVYHWAYFTKEHGLLSDDVAERMNQRLQKLGIDGRLQFHFFEVDEYITPEILDEAYEMLGGKMDFVSMSPSLAGFYKEEWQNRFIELTEELQSGGLNGFYTKVPKMLWEINKIADGIYSFSNGKQIGRYGYRFYEAAVDELGEENIMSLQKADGLEDETLWKELYERRNKPVVLWNGLGWGTSPSKDDPYYRSSLHNLVSGYDVMYFETITDDMRYNYETEEIEWLGESETYQAILDQLMVFYNKGYIIDIGVSHIEPEELMEKIMTSVGWIVSADNVEPRYVEGGAWGTEMYFSNTAKGYVTNKEPFTYVYSCVYHKAHQGWQEVLNVIGQDDELTMLLNFGIGSEEFKVLRESDETFTIKGGSQYTNTMTSEIFYQVLFNEYEVEEAYELLEKRYQGIEISPMGDFIFNPAPVAKQMKRCNGAASMFISLDQSRLEANLDGTPKDPTILKEVIDAYWNSYITAMKQTPINEIVDEANRQLDEWRAENG